MKKENRDDSETFHDLGLAELILWILPKSNIIPIKIPVPYFREIENIQIHMETQRVTQTKLF